MHPPTLKEIKKNMAVMMKSKKRMKMKFEVNMTYMYNKNRTVYHANFVNILKGKINYISPSTKWNDMRNRINGKKIP